MTGNQENKVSMFHLTEEKLNFYSSIWGPIPAFVATKTAFSNRLLSINEAALIQMAINTGISTDKKVLKLTMIDSVAPIGLNLKALASQTNNNELFDAVNLSHSELSAKRDELVGGVCQIILNHATANLVALADFGVDAPVIAAAQLTITAYAAKVPAPGSAKVTKKTATLNLKNHIKAADVILNDQLDGMMAQFKTTQPDFHNDYFGAREIIDLGATHTRFRGFVKDQLGSPLPGAMVALLQGGLVLYSIVSDANGNVNVPKVKPGFYDLKVIKPGYTTKNETGIQFKAGKAVKRSVSLVPGAATQYITVVREGDVAPNSVVNISTDGIKGTPLTMVTVEVTLGPLGFYAAATPDALPGPTQYLRPIGIITIPLVDFATAIGFGSGLDLLNVQNAGGLEAHYKLTFTNVEPE